MRTFFSKNSLIICGFSWESILIFDPCSSFDLVLSLLLEYERRKGNVDQTLASVDSETCLGGRSGSFFLWLSLLRKIPSPTMNACSLIRKIYILGLDQVLFMNFERLNWEIRRELQEHGAEALTNQPHVWYFSRQGQSITPTSTTRKEVNVLFNLHFTSKIQWPRSMIPSSPCMLHPNHLISASFCALTLSIGPAPSILWSPMDHQITPNSPNPIIQI